MKLELKLFKDLFFNELTCISADRWADFGVGRADGPATVEFSSPPSAIGLQEVNVQVTVRGINDLIAIDMQDGDFALAEIIGLGGNPPKG